jgi:hypothetical protein
MDETSTGLSDLEKEIEFLEKNKSKFSPDFSKSYETYMGMLEPLGQSQRGASIYDLATSLSKGLTAQAASGQPASIGMGFAMGFNNFSDYEKARRQAQLERMEKMKMQAATMAIDDVREGDKLYNQLITQRLIKDPSKLGKVIQYNKYDTDGRTVIATETASEKDKPAIDALLKDGYRKIEEKSGNVFNIGEQGPDKVENQFVLDAHNTVKESEEKAAASIDNDQNLDKFTFLQNQIPESGFGKGANLVGEIQEYVVDIPIVGEYFADQKTISARQALKNTQIGFVLGIVGPYKGAISNKELSIFQASVAGLANEAEANKFILVTGARANQIARNKAEAERIEYTKHYGQWKRGEIDGSELTSRMNTWRKEWARDDNPESMIFTPEVLEQLGKTKDQLPKNDREAREFYARDLINQGVPEQEAKRLAREMFVNIDDFTTFYDEYQSDYNSKLAADGEVIVVD